LQTKYQDEFAYNPSYIEMYRHGNAYHGAHPFYMEMRNGQATS